MPVSVLFHFLAGLLLCLIGGCCCCSVNNPRLACSFGGSRDFRSADLECAESALQKGVDFEDACDPACVDLFFLTATLAWPELHKQVDRHGVPCGAAANVYKTALGKLIQSAQQWGRLDPGSGLQILTADGSIFVPAVSHGFLWQPHEIDRLIPVEDYSIGELNHKYSCCGYGVPAIAIHCEQADKPFRKKEQLFSATVLLRPAPVTDPPASGGFVLELYDPLRVSVIEIAGRPAPLYRDLTAPLAWQINNRDRNYLTGFLQPGSTTENEGLHMIEPYQPGKIPILFVHGLMSDPLVWANMANEIRACPEFVDRYQLWAFEYATGEPFLKSAAMLRRQLHVARALLDPTCSDPALEQILVVGHSMGGLVARLQISQSSDHLWNAVSCRPLHAIRAPQGVKAQLAESFFFEPSPFISHVVFIGVPHHGSPWANRPVGVIGASLVEEPSSLETEHEKLIANNPGVFSSEFARRVPTSIDLLKPQSPLLQSISQLERAPDIHLHSIIGGGHWMIGAGDSDSVVPVSSARTPGVVSETLIEAKHSELPRGEEGIAALFRIMRMQLAEIDGLQDQPVIPAKAAR